jgi:hypothetical protein
MEEAVHRWPVMSPAQPALSAQIAVPGLDMQHHCQVMPVHPFGNNLVAHEIGDAAAPPAVRRGDLAMPGARG